MIIGYCVTVLQKNEIYFNTIHIYLLMHSNWVYFFFLLWAIIYKYSYFIPFITS